MAVVWLLTRDYRTRDNTTAELAFSEAVSTNQTAIYPVFMCNPEQLDESQNPYHNHNSIQFMMESLEFLTSSIQLTVVTGYEELAIATKGIGATKLFLARDFTPFAEQRVAKLRATLGIEVLEINDFTLRVPENAEKVPRKLGPFIESHKTITTPSRFVLERKHTKKVPGFNKTPREALGKYFTSNPNLLLRPDMLSDLISTFPDNIRGYSKKTVREKIKQPAVSMMSPFVKFGLISIRELYHLPDKFKKISEDDALEFKREVMFREFFYHLAVYDHDQVFNSHTWSSHGAPPKFCYEEDLLEYKKYTKSPLVITDSERVELEKNLKLLSEWITGDTPYEVVNVGMRAMVSTGYMINRARMLCVSYITRDCGLWWKYAEMVFAQYLIDYDWTINALNHQNIARIGVYPKYTRDFSMLRQEHNYSKERD